MDTIDNEQLAGLIEALIFVSGDPVPAKRLAELLDKTTEEIDEALEALTERYLETGAGIHVMEVAGGYQLRTRPVYSHYVNRFLERKRKTTLSGPALETLAIIAYKQPITRVEIEAIRGVVVDGVIKSLLDKRLIKIAGVKEVPGRPHLYRTTKRFLEYFGIGSLKDLPPVDDISATYSSGIAASGEEPLSEQEESEAIPDDGSTGEPLPDESPAEPAHEPAAVETSTESDKDGNETEPAPEPPETE